MIIVLLGLTLPQLISAGFNYARTLKEFKEWEVTRLSIVNGLIFLLCYLVPVSFQFSSLIFGIIRKKNDKKLRVVDSTSLMTRSHNDRNGTNVEDSSCTDNSTVMDP